MLEKNDLESASQPLYPAMEESPELRWSFIRKIYGILSAQLLLTVAVVSLVVYVHPISLFFTTTWIGFALYIVLIITTIMVLCSLLYFYKRHPLNYILLGVLTFAFAFVLGLSCSFTSGKVILEAFILTATMVVSLTLYIFWAARRGHEFVFMLPFLLGVLSIVIVFVWIQIFFPLGRIGVTIYGLVGAIIGCLYIVIDTLSLITRYTYDEYILAAIMLYADVLYLFTKLLVILTSCRLRNE